MLKTTLKLALALALCYWLFTNGKLDFSLVSKTFRLGYLWLLAIFFFLLHYAINTYRFRSLLMAKTKHSIPYLKVLSFDAVGSFFTVILPGTAGGDLVRFFYYKNISSEISPPAVASIILLDRCMGLLGLMLIGSVVCLVKFDTLRAINPALVSLIYTNIFLTVGATTFILIIFSDLFPQEVLLKKFLHYLERWPKISSTLTDLISLKMTMTVLLRSLFYTIFSQTLTIATFWALAYPFIPAKVTFLDLFTIIPIGFIGASLPIAPAGLGIGHLFFENLFNLLHVDHGASLYNLFFILNVVVCLFGVIPYLLIKDDMKEKIQEKIKEKK